jgi:hypothetical protein
MVRYRIVSNATIDSCKRNYRFRVTVGQLNIVYRNRGEWGEMK